MVTGPLTIEWDRGGASPVGGSCDPIVAGCNYETLWTTCCLSDPDGIQVNRRRQKAQVVMSMNTSDELERAARCHNIDRFANLQCSCR